MGGCGARAAPAPGAFSSTSAHTTARGDFDDLDAALLVGAMRAEMAVVTFPPRDGDVRLYELKSVTDETAWVEARRNDGGIELRARVGLWGDPGRERALLKAIRVRLEQLRGRDWAPVD